MDVYKQTNAPQSSRNQTSNSCVLSGVKAGFHPGIFSGGGAKSIVMQVSFVMLLFSDQISGRGKVSGGGGQTA